MATATSGQTVKGGSWLVEQTPASDVMTPEKITDDGREMLRALGFNV